MKIAVAAVQMSSELLDVPANLERADNLLRAAHGAGVELAVLPELFNTGYSLLPDFGPHSETVEGPTLSIFASVAGNGGWVSRPASLNARAGISTIH